MIQSLPSRFESAMSTKTPHQREMDYLRRRADLDWAPRAGCQPKTLAMCCEKCVYGTGEHRLDCITSERITLFGMDQTEWADWPFR